MRESILTETIVFHAINETPVRRTCLDATEKFDRIHFDEFFTLLVFRGMMLVKLYAGNLRHLSWNGEMRDYFTVTTMSLNKVDSIVW